jgi:hypothetical protein
MRSLLVFLLLLLLKVLSRLFYRHDLGWVGEVPPRRWSGYRVVALLNHTSLFEFLWAGSPPSRFLWQIARHGVVPVADITLGRPLVGRFFRVVARHVVPISRERDHTWIEVMARIDDPRALVVILPEGRMMRKNGLDKHGKPMTVRGGIADILEAIAEGRLLLAYSGGLHHVQAPGERWPRLFRTIRIRFECLDIPAYRQGLLAEGGAKGFRRAVVADLERRRDLHCWPDPADRPGTGSPAARVSPHVV